VSPTPSEPPRDGEQRIRAAVLELLRERKGRASIGPADVARRIDPDGWKRWMERVKETARRMAAEGTIEVTRHGKPVDAWPWRGVVRFRNPVAHAPLADATDAADAASGADEGDTTD
jgi:hypothetical protein